MEWLRIKARKEGWSVEGMHRTGGRPGQNGRVTRGTGFILRALRRKKHQPWSLLSAGQCFSHLILEPQVNPSPQVSGRNNWTRVIICLSHTWRWQVCHFWREGLRRGAQSSSFQPASILQQPLGCNWEAGDKNSWFLIYKILAFWL